MSDSLELWRLRRQRDAERRRFAYRATFKWVFTLIAIGAGAGLGAALNDAIQGGTSFRDHFLGGLVWGPACGVFGFCIVMVLLARFAFNPLTAPLESDVPIKNPFRLGAIVGIGLAAAASVRMAASGLSGDHPRTLAAMLISSIGCGVALIACCMGIAVHPARRPPTSAESGEI